MPSPENIHLQSTLWISRISLRLLTFGGLHFAFFVCNLFLPKDVVIHMRQWLWAGSEMCKAAMLNSALSRGGMKFVRYLNVSFQNIHFLREVQVLCLHNNISINTDLCFFFCHFVNAWCHFWDFKFGHICYGKTCTFSLYTMHYTSILFCP